MEKYSALIRKLVNSTALAEHEHEDVADVLKNRCFNDTDIVRRTLMNAVCDPRFKLEASLVGRWKKCARIALSHLAEQLDAAESLNDEGAEYILNDFLNSWVLLARDGFRIDDPNAELVDETEPEDYIDEALELMDELQEEDDNEEDEEEQEDDEEEKEEDNEDEEDKGKKSTEEKSTSEHHLREERPPRNKYNSKPNDGKQPTHLKRRNVSGTGRRPVDSINIQKIEEMYLELIPKSLIKLARRIGRTGLEGYEESGKFMKASKSDIAGITTGNNLHAIIPSELSMLADSKTQKVFYHRYATNRLQLFASASHSKAPVKRKDGPVIICVDTSSSMGGDPIKIARALAIAVCIIAWKRNRDVIMVKYSDTYEYKDLGHRHSGLSEVSEFLTHANNAGNNENSMFQGLFESVLPQRSEYKSADILCISDFGWTTLSTKTLDLIGREKEKGMMFYGLNVERDVHLAGLMSKQHDVPPSMHICDSLWTYSKGECIELTGDSLKIGCD